MNINSKTLKEGLEKVSPIVQKQKPAVPEWGMVGLLFGDDSVTITSSNGTSYCEYKIQADLEELKNAESILFEPFQLLGVLGNMYEQLIEIHVNRNEMRISVDSGFGTEMEFAYIDGSHSSINFTPSDSFVLNTSIFTYGIKKCASFANKDDIRPILTNIHFEVNVNSFTFVSTNTLKLIEYSVGHEMEVSQKTFVNIPPGVFPMVYQLSDSEETILSYNERFIELKQGNYSARNSLSEGKYPPYKNIFPKTTKEFKVSRIEFMNSIKRASLFCNDENHCVLTLEGSVLTIKSEYNHKIKEKLKATNEQDASIEFVCNIQFISEIANKIDSMELKFEFIDHSKAFLVSGDENTICLFMPIFNLK